MKITVYTIADDKSAFCKDLKGYLKSKNMPFEEKRVDQNRDALSEMLTVSSNFAGVPFTVVEKDDGTKTMLKGFTQSEFDQAMTGSTTSATPSAPVKPMPTTPTPATTTTTTTTTTPTATPLTPPTMPAMPTAAPMPAEGQASKAQAELDGILNDLKSKGGVDLGLQPSTPTMPQAPQVPSMPSMPSMPSTPPAPVSTPPPAPAMPSMPSMPPATPATPTMPPVPQAPKIPDFPAK